MSVAYYKSLKTYAYTGIALCVSFMAFSPNIVDLFPEFLVKLFTNDVELIKVCIPVAYVLCFFQIFDGLQVALAGIFKGIKKTSIIMISNLIAYWFVSIPLGCMLALYFKMNLLGFWYSLGVSAIILCTIMLTTLIRQFNKLRES